LIIQNLKVKSTLYKNFKRHKIKDHSDIFRIVFGPSSGSIKLYLAENRSGSLMFVVCLAPGKTRYPLYRRLGGPQGQSGLVRKISPHWDSIPGELKCSCVYKNVTYNTLWNI